MARRDELITGITEYNKQLGEYSASIGAAREDYTAGKPSLKEAVEVAQGIGKQLMRFVSYLDGAVAHVGEGQKKLNKAGEAIKPLGLLQSSDERANTLPAKLAILLAQNEDQETILQAIAYEAHNFANIISLVVQTCGETLTGAQDHDDDMGTLQAIAQASIQQGEEYIESL